MKNTIFILLCCLAFGATQAQTKLTCTGGYIVSQGSSSNLVFKDAYLNIPAQTTPAVTGIFVPGTGKVKFTGSATAGQSYIRMDDTLNSSLYNLEIAKTLNNARLQSNVKVKKNVLLTSGGLEIQNRKLLLNNGSNAQVVGETEVLRVFGTIGYAERVKNLNAPTAENLSNLGGIITSTANLGSTTLRRSNVGSVLPSGNSALRTYRIKKAGATNATITLRFSYFDVELNGNNEATMVIWRKTGSGPWTAVGATSRDGSANWVESNSCILVNTQENYFTLGPPTTTLEQQTNVLTEFSTSTDDADLGSEISDKTEMMFSAAAWSAYPNPATSEVYFSIQSPLLTEATLAWYDATGRLVKFETQPLTVGMNTVRSEVKDLATGTYFVTCLGWGLKPLHIQKYDE